MHPAKRKGDGAERQAAALISRLLGLTVRRRLGAGRTTAAGGDLGDLEGVPDHAIQVANWADVAAAARIKPPQAQLQANQAGVTYGATWVRFRGGTWRVVLTPEQWVAYVRRTLPEQPR